MDGANHALKCVLRVLHAWRRQRDYNIGTLWKDHLPPSEALHHASDKPMTRLPLLTAFLFLILAGYSAHAQDSYDSSATSAPVKELILPGESFLVDGRPAFVLLPLAEARQAPQPWIMYAPTLPGLPDEHEKWMHQQFLAAGVAVAGIDVGEAYGSPKGRECYDALYRELTLRRGFARQCVLLGRSRGGLWNTSWAVHHPEKVAGMACIYPVFDLTVWPGIQTAAPAYELTSEQLSEQLRAHNPIEQVSVLAQAGVPVFLIHGDEDQVVPLEQNSAEMLRRYVAAGGQKLIELSIAPGQGHNYWPGFFRCRELIDFVIRRAKIGAEARQSASPDPPPDDR